MTQLLVGTKKGLFVLEGTAGKPFEVTARAFAGEPVEFATRDPRSGRMLVAVTSAFYGPKIFYADDLAGEWKQASGVELPEDAEKPLERLWTIEPAEDDGHLYAGGAPGLPPFRVFNAYLGSSAASGFAPFADGNNQESSSEAVAAWEAAVRWGLVRHDDALVRYGVTHYALEAATARRYWLGEGQPRRAGYAHTAAGIVWDAKTDFATWFDAKPESILGIQLLPATFGSLYRAGVSPRVRSLDAPPRAWADLFAADLAMSDPAAARRMLDGANLPREDSTSRGLVRYFVAAMAVLGRPGGKPAPVGSLDFTRGGRVSTP